MKLSTTFAKEDPNPVLLVRRVSKIVNGDVSPWKVEDNGVLGLSTKSDLISYLFQQYTISPN